jgi:6-phosphogluconolactonase
MVRRELLDAVGAPASFVPWREGGDPVELAAEYERTLLGILDADAGGPRPDLILAGIGDDGHTLSLFPGTAALGVDDHWFVANWVEQMDTWRFTATYPLVHRARLVVVLVSGASKAPALAEILEPTSEDRLPAARLMDGGAEVVWLVDQAAAGLLRTTPTTPAG